MRSKFSDALAVAGYRPLSSWFWPNATRIGLALAVKLDVSTIGYALFSELDILGINSVHHGGGQEPINYAEIRHIIELSRQSGLPENRVPLVFRGAALFMLPVLWCAGATAASDAGGIRPYEGNPFYWQYKGKPILLLGASDSHQPPRRGQQRSGPNRTPYGREGQFRFQLVPPGTYVLELRAGSNEAPSHQTPVTVAPGVSTKVHIGPLDPDVL